MIKSSKARPLKIIYFLVFLFLVGCDGQADRFSELTGSGSGVERVYICSKVSEWDAVRLRILREQLKDSASDKEIIMNLISEADNFSDQFITMLDGYSSDEVKVASRAMDKKFTDNDFSKLLEEYGKLLKAHCADMLD